MAREKERRYATASELAADIRRYLADEPIAARPATPLYHLAKFARRNRVLVASVVVFVLGLVAAVAVISRHAIELRKAERDTARALSTAEKALADSELARKAEEEQRRRAERAVQVHRGIHEYVATMLGVTDATSGGGRNVTVRDWLDGMAAEVASNVSRDPEIRAHLHHLVGEIHLGISDYDGAEEHLLTALELQEESDAPDARLVASASSRLGGVHRVRGEFALARERLEQGRRLYEELGAHSEVVGARIDLLQLMLDEGSDAAAAEEIDDVLALARSPGVSARHLELALGLDGNLALAHGDFEHALKRAEERIEILESSFTAGDPRLGTALNDVGLAQMALGRNEDAVRSLRRSIEVYGKTLNDGHSAVGASWMNLANCLSRLERDDEAVEAVNVAVRVLEGSLGRLHERALEAMSFRALLLSNTGGGRSRSSSTRASCDASNRLLRVPCACRPRASAVTSPASSS